MSNLAARIPTQPDDSSSEASGHLLPPGNTAPGLQRVSELPNHQGKGGESQLQKFFTANQTPVTFEQANQHVGWQYNAGRDIIINVQSGGELATELTKMQEQVRESLKHQVISQEVATHMQKQLDVIIQQLQSNQPQADVILEKLQTTRGYLQEESVKLAQQIPQQREGSKFFRVLAGVATLVAIAFDLGITAAVVTGLFGLSTHRSVV